MARYLYIHHPSSLDHDTGAHPECAERIRVIESAMEGRDWLGFEREAATVVSPSVLESVHSSTYIRSIQETSRRGGHLDPATVVAPGSWNAALHAAGGAVVAVDALLGGDAKAVFCALRPPGHHAEVSRAGGFCLFNNVAVAARHALDAHSIKRVMIVDWDAHHGNGTNDIFWEDGRVLYISIHQAPLYPGTGALTDSGSGTGEGFTVNLPVPPHTDDTAYFSLLEHLVAPMATQFEPGLILVSAGYDAHRDDPLTFGALEISSFRALGAWVRRISDTVDAQVGLVLEGGYDLRSLGASVVATLEGIRNGAPGSGDVGIHSLVERPLEHYRRWWELPALT